MFLVLPTPSPPFTSTTPPPPGVVLTPCVVYLLQPPEVKATPEAPAAAAARLHELGPLKREEWLMVLSAGLATLLWVSRVAT